MSRMACTRRSGGDHQESASVARRTGRRNEVIGMVEAKTQIQQDDIYGRFSELLQSLGGAARFADYL
jgi:hypothetical protein